MPFWDPLQHAMSPFMWRCFTVCFTGALPQSCWWAPGRCEVVQGRSCLVRLSGQPVCRGRERLGVGRPSLNAASVELQDTNLVNNRSPQS